MQARSAFSEPNSLTGLWSGEYWYAGVSFPTPFTAHFIDTNGDLTGSTLEPNRFANPDLLELSASLTGARGDLSVRFTKLYNPAPGVHRQPIFYTGVVDASFTMIDGEWSFAPEYAMSGRFVLVRVSRGETAATVAAAAERSIKR